MVKLLPDEVSTMLIVAQSSYSLENDEKTMKHVVMDSSWYQYRMA